MSERARHRPPLTVAKEAPDTPAGEHTHEQPRPLLLWVVTVVVVLLAVVVGWLGYITYGLQRDQAEITEYIEGRGQFRDAEADRLDRRITDAVCDVLDTLPAGGLLDPVREQYGCGPGIPVDQLSPEAARNLSDIVGGAAQPPTSAPEATAEPVPTSEPDELPPGAPAGAQPSPMGQLPTTAPPTPAPVTPAPTTAPTVPPLVDLTPLTDPACALVGVCLGPN